MPSLITGFEYDIFISYRHNDNLTGHAGERWVTEFVQNLKRELVATIKEPIHIYMDENQHDGILEIHNVDQSLSKKIKCLVLIPIISQTYCDPKGFAWKNEFLAFNELAKADQFGKDITLANGNVTSRILPVKIHDLDAEDTKLLTREWGGVLRAIEFIFKSAGVNRPLLPSDNPEKNSNRTFYWDQINKVANGVKEIISALKNFEHRMEIPAMKSESPHRKLDPWKILKVASFVALFLILSSYVILNFVGIINLSNQEQQPIHKLILPFFIVAVVAVVARHPLRKMGQIILSIVSFAIIGGGAIDFMYTFVSTKVPDPYIHFLEINEVDVPDQLVRLEFGLLRCLGSALIATGIGALILLRGHLSKERKGSVMAVVLMFTFTSGTNAWELYALNSPFYIYSITFFVLTLIGGGLWWKGVSSEMAAQVNGPQ